MPDFNDFLKFANQNMDKIIYDAYNEAEAGGVNVLNMPHSAEIAGLSYAVAVSVLRQYHEWLHSISE